VDYFFDVVLGSQLDDRALYAVAEYLSSDIVQKHDSQIIGKRTSLPVSTLTQSPTKTEAPTTSLNESGNPVKEGYLTKRGKNFGGWQTRYFVLDGPQLKYFDTVYFGFYTAKYSLMGFISEVSNYHKHRSDVRITKQMMIRPMSR